MSKAIKWYSVYSLIKFAALASFITVVAIERQNAITSHYNADNCMTCLNAAKTHPESLYEFDQCHLKYTPNVHGKNLLYNHPVKGWFPSNGSKVPNYAYDAFAACAIAVAAGIIVVFLSFNARLNRENNESFVTILVLLSFFVIVLLLSLGTTVFSLYLKDGCYVQAVSAGYMDADLILSLLFVVLISLQGLLEEDDNRAPLLFISVLVLFTYAIFSLVVAFLVFFVSHNWVPVVYALICFASIFEVPVMLLGVETVKEMLVIQRRPTPAPEPHLENAMGVEHEEGQPNPGRNQRAPAMIM